MRLLFASIACGLVGGLAGGLLVHSLQGDAAPSRERAAPRQVGVVDEEEIAERVWERLRHRIPRQPAGGAASPDAAPLDQPAESPGAPAPGAPAGAGETGVDARVREFVDGLRTRRYDHAAVSTLWSWMQSQGNHKRITQVISLLGAEVEQDPNNADLRVALASAYVGELSYNTAPGAQQGIVWGRAATQYEAAIELEPEHWDARFGKAFGTTFIPKQFGMRPSAIRQFEELKEIQEKRAPEAHFAQTYLQLGMLYKDEGNQDEAREVWEQGRKLFPDDARLQAQLEVATKR